MGERGKGLGIRDELKKVLCSKSRGDVSSRPLTLDERCTAEMAPREESG